MSTGACAPSSSWARRGLDATALEPGERLSTLPGVHELLGELPREIAGEAVVPACTHAEYVIRPEGPADAVPWVEGVIDSERDTLATFRATDGDGACTRRPTTPSRRTTGGARFVAAPSRRGRPIATRGSWPLRMATPTRSRRRSTRPARPAIDDGGSRSSLAAARQPNRRLGLLPGFLATCEEHIDSWADRNRAQGWPAGIPRHLVSDYLRQLGERRLPRRVAWLGARPPKATLVNTPSSLCPSRHSNLSTQLGRFGIHMDVYSRRIHFVGYRTVISVALSPFGDVDAR